MPEPHLVAATSVSRLLRRIQEDIAKAEGERVETEVVKRYTCSPGEFHEIEDFLEESPCKGVSFNAAQESLRFILVLTIVHGACSAWFSEWGSQFPKQVRDHLRFQTESDVNKLGEDEQSKKVPDNSINVRGRAMPTIALEVGYSESYEDLINDATLLLEGSQGRIGLVILVKVTPLTAALESIQSGFVETHIYDQVTQKRAKFRSRMRLYPPTTKHTEQKITLPWQTILREKRTAVNPTTESPPPLVLDELRRLIDEAVVQTLLLRSNKTAQAERNASIL
ncbi:hypothetical protein PISL3812_05333 [Talaromyces islandicus]|uniref:Uncharacterized protein n=1 Tax=Talaromyces islandicus TaxID=28573 RepID=A0A0U1LY85_TALIS|nr:hypothetical protein PISL3812_05333 [Talaromyces islandicus]